TAKSFDNTIDLSATTWRHVGFIERDEPVSGQETNLGDPFSWLFIADSCKHCEDAGCLDNCPTGALVRTEYDTVYVQPDICNGCGTCVVSCPFGVIDKHPTDGRAWKCTMCYDRLKDDETPACAQACPTEAIAFGELSELRERADVRLAELHDRGVSEARLYGAHDDDLPGTRGLHAFYLLLDSPDVYSLPTNPVAPQNTVNEGWRSMAGALGAMAVGVGVAMLSGRRAR
ncbi:MAG: 4Fe-4S binding protein, partial [Candidatus Microthrix sp.]|nr:4Fe-4S binding protein [Candidatus Microthrix sp.]MBP9834475.1 4Fe-4S binding protein [Candidatus Microthrix sp.]